MDTVDINKFIEVYIEEKEKTEGARRKACTCSDLSVRILSTPDDSAKVL